MSCLLLSWVTKIKVDPDFVFALQRLSVPILHLGGARLATSADSVVPVPVRAQCVGGAPIQSQPHVPSYSLLLGPTTPTNFFLRAVLWEEAGSAHLREGLHRLARESSFGLRNPVPNTYKKHAAGATNFLARPGRVRNTVSWRNTGFTRRCRGVEPSVPVRRPSTVPPRTPPGAKPSDNRAAAEVFAGRPSFLPPE